MCPEQQPSNEARARRSLALGTRDNKTFLPDLPGTEHVPQRNRPAETSVFVEVKYANTTKISEYEGTGLLVKYITRKD